MIGIAIMRSALRGLSALTLSSFLSFAFAAFLSFSSCFVGVRCVTRLLLFSFTCCVGVRCVVRLLFPFSSCFVGTRCVARLRLGRG